MCKYIQTLFTATNNKWKDSFYNKQYGLYNIALGEGEEILLQKITSVDVTTIDLKWHSKISTYVALVKAENKNQLVFPRQTKNKTITKRNIIIKKKNVVNKFKPIYSFNISIRSDKHRCLLKVPNLVVKTLGRSNRLSKKDINMESINHVVNTTGKIHKSKCFRASLNATEKLGYKKTVHYVNERLALMPLNVEHHNFQAQIYFKSPDKAKEYLWIN